MEKPHPELKQRLEYPASPRPFGRSGTVARAEKSKVRVISVLVYSITLIIGLVLLVVITTSGCLLHYFWNSFREERLAGDVAPCALLGGGKKNA